MLTAEDAAFHGFVRGFAAEERDVLLVELGMRAPRPGHHGSRRRTEADAVELGGQAPAGKSSSTRAVHVVALSPPATKGGDAQTLLPTHQR